MTADDLLDMPDDGLRRELVKGEVRTMPPTGGEHGAITFKLSLALGNYIVAHNLGMAFGAETGFKIASDPDTVRAPDLAFIRQERIPATGIPKGYVPLAPDLVVEVISPHDKVYAVDEKTEEWLTAGVRAVWVVNPKRRTVTIYRPQAKAITLAENEELDGQDVVPGFRCRVAEMFV